MELEKLITTDENVLPKVLIRFAFSIFLARGFGLVVVQTVCNTVGIPIRNIHLATL